MQTRSKTAALDLCTPEERAHMCEVGTKFADHERSEFGTATVIHPTRLHAEFRDGKQNSAHEILEEVDLGDGYTRVTMLLNPVLSAERAVRKSHTGSPIEFVR